MRKILPLMMLVVWLAPVSAQAEEPGYITLSFGRTQWVSAANCVPIQGAIPLNRVAEALSARGLTGVGNVVTSRTNETARRCVNGSVQYASWADLAMLRDIYGWKFVSASLTYPNMTTLTPEQQYAESCGSLDVFTDHGHTSAWGMFAYPGNKFTEQIQTDTVSTCFAFGRRYGVYVPNARSTTTAPWFQVTHALEGGKCNIPSLPCYTMTTRGDNLYESPRVIAAYLDVAPDEWAVLQAYRFVTGKGGSGAWSWDCSPSATGWKAHWTSATELYCWNDYIYILNHLPTSALVTDPATVATAWGRTLP